MIFGLDGIDAHQRGFMRFGAIRPKQRASNEIGAKSLQPYYGHPYLVGKRLVRATQRTQFLVLKMQKNDLKPMDFFKRNSYFETERVSLKYYLLWVSDLLLFYVGSTLTHVCIP